MSTSDEDPISLISAEGDVCTIKRRHACNSKYLRTILETNFFGYRNPEISMSLFSYDTLEKVCLFLVYKSMNSSNPNVMEDFLKKMNLATDDEFFAAAKLLDFESV